MHNLFIYLVALFLHSVVHGSQNTCSKPVSMVETSLSDKNKYLFAFSQKGLPFNHINVPAGLKLEGQSVDLVLEVCAFVGVCCDVVVVPPTNCWDNSLVPGFSPGLNEMSYDFCADIDFETNKNLSYAFSSQPYRAGLADLRLMVRKDSRALARFWDKALTHFMCSDEYEDFCQLLTDKYSIDADCIDPSTLDCGSLGHGNKFGHFKSLKPFLR